jgi:hypothetical protein
MGLAADANQNGVIDSGDYDIWKANFGQHSLGAGAGAAVPEPSGLMTISLAASTVLILCKPLGPRQSRRA